MNASITALVSEFRVLVMPLGDLAVPPDALAIVVGEPFFAEDFGHGLLSLPEVAHHLFQPVFGLGIAGAVSRPGRCGGEDVGHAEVVPQDFDPFGARGEPRRHGQQ